MWLVLQQNDKGDLYGRPIVVHEHATASLQEVLEAAYRSDSAPLDHRLARAIVVPVAGGENPQAIPVQAYRPQWKFDETQTIGGDQ